MLTECLQLMRQARSNMCKNYGNWDYNQQVYEGIIKPTKEDVAARERKEPERMIVPMTYAQVQTFVAFLFHLYHQRPTFFELSGSGLEDMRAAKIAEAVLQQNLTYNQWQVVLYQFLLNIGKFGFGVLKHSWTKETVMRYQRMQTAASPGLFGSQLPGQTLTQLVAQIKYMGNRIESVNPYRIFFDPSVPMHKFQEGEFVASEMDAARTWLRKMERSAGFVNTSLIGKFRKEDWDGRTTSGMRSEFNMDPTAGDLGGAGRNAAAAEKVIVTEVQRVIIPSEYKLPDGSPLGPEDYPTKYVIVIGNENRIVKCEPLGYPHDNFTYHVAQFSPDIHAQLSTGISDLISELQNTITWLFNSRISNVRKTIHNQAIVDPEGIEMSDLNERRPFIRLKKSAARTGVDRWYKPVDINDVTQSHIGDAQTLGSLMQVLTGINENAIGQYSTGRRSAEQTRAVNAGAASRLKMIGSLVWAQALAPAGADWLENLRSGLDAPQLVKIVGAQLNSPTNPYAPGPNDVAQFLKITRDDLAGMYDFVPLDGVLASEKVQVANSLQEVLVGVLTNPQAAAVLGLDPRALLTEIATLLGIRNPERFFLNAQGQQFLMQQLMLAQMPSQPAVPSAGASGTPPGVIQPPAAPIATAAPSMDAMLAGLISP